MTANMKLRLNRFCRTRVNVFKRPMADLIKIGGIDSSDTLGTALHHWASKGKKKALKSILDKGIHVDYPNDEGQTPLFCACLAGHYKVIDCLLAYGANPNEKTNLGLTPLHAACYAADVEVIMKLLKEGGDLRLHDYQGRGVKDWAILNPTPAKRMKILEFLDKARMFAMSSSGQDLLMRKASSRTVQRANLRKNSVTAVIRGLIGRPSVNKDLERMASKQHYLGFGHVYSSGSNQPGFMSAIPLVTENSLIHDKDGDTYNNGAFFVMESMWWDYSEVMVKRLHRDQDPYQGGVVDLLINEIEHIGKLRHPNILTLMGVCQNNNLDGLILIYERVREGSLYNFLHHHKIEQMPTQMIQNIAIQMCNAIIFIHLRGLVHCAITSHAINVINSATFKLGNFEYMTEVSKCEWGKKNAVATNTTENAVYNWMAPEVMFDMPPSYYCDMFSYCAVLWEVFHGDVPFDGQSASSIKSQYSKGKGLSIVNGKIPDYFKIILDYGLQQDPTKRKLSFLHVRDLLRAAPKDSDDYVRTHFQHLHFGENDGGGQSDSRSQPDAKSRSLSPSRQDKGYGSKNANDSKNADKQRGGSGKEKQAKNKEGGQNEYKFYMDSVSGQTEIPKKKINYLEDTLERRKKEKQVEEERKSRREVFLTNYNTKMRNGGNKYEVLPPKPARQLHYSEEGLSWDAFPKEEGEEYVYSVHLRREPSPKKSPKLSGREELEIQRKERKISGREELETQRKEPWTTQDDKVTSEEDSGQNSTESSSNTTEYAATQYADEGDLNRKVSSMGHFSYLTSEKHQRTRSAGAKPACHGHYDNMVAEEYSTSGKLTTSGSLYYLYNDHSPNLPLGQMKDRREYPVYATMPRAKQPSAPVMEIEQGWFGGRGSVRNLAQVFQQQIQEHHNYQAVLDGILSKNRSAEKLEQPEDGMSLFGSGDQRRKFQDFGNHANIRQPGRNAETGSMESVSSSMTTADIGDIEFSNHDSIGKSDENAASSCIESVASSIHVTGTDNNGEPMNVHQIAFDVASEESDSSSFTTGDLSSDSKVVDKWVDHELRKIKRKLSRERMAKLKYRQLPSSVDLFDQSDNYGKSGMNEKQVANQALYPFPRQFNSTSELTEVTPDTSETSLIDHRQEAGDHATNNGMEEEFYFDDEIYPKYKTRASNKGSPRRSVPSSPVREMVKPRLRRSTKNDGMIAREQEQQNCCPLKTNLPMISVMKKTVSPSPKKKSENQAKTDAYKKRLSKIPTSRSKLPINKAKCSELNAYDREGAFENIVTVRSSLEETGLHQVTHQVRNLKTGGSNTMVNKLVNGQRIVTKFKAAT